MILLNKSLSAQTIFVTAYEITPDVTTGMTLSLFNLYTNVSSVLTLGNDISLYPERINEYLILGSISGYSVGKYSFQVFNGSDIMVEEGICEIRDNVLTPTQEVDEQYTFIPPTATDEDYLVYQ